MLSSILTLRSLCGSCRSSIESNLSIERQTSEVPTPNLLLKGNSNISFARKVVLRYRTAAATGIDKIIVLLASLQRFNPKYWKLSKKVSLFAAQNTQLNSQLHLQHLQWMSVATCAPRLFILYLPLIILQFLFTNSFFFVFFPSSSSLSSVSQHRET
jgi:hypothetical protein